MRTDTAGRSDDRVDDRADDVAPTPVETKARPAKSARTEALIVDAALALFGEQGYDDTTMRQIAARAGMSVGSSYYYFASKEAIVQRLYEQFSLRTYDAAIARAADAPDLTAKIEAAMLAWIDVMAPFRRFAAAFFRSAADFGSSVSPFSAETADIRKHAYDLWRTVVDSAPDVPPATPGTETAQERIPQVLWLFALGIVALWSQDPTDDAQRTGAVIRRSAPVVAQLVKLARTPLFAPMAGQLAGLLDDIAAVRAPV